MPDRTSRRSALVAGAAPWSAAPAAAGLVLVCVLTPIGVLGHGHRPLVALTSTALQGLALSLIVSRPRLATAVQVTGVLVLAVAGPGVALASIGLVLHVTLLAATQAFCAAATGWWALALAVTAIAGDDLAVLGPIIASALVLVAIPAVRRRDQLRVALSEAVSGVPGGVEVDPRQLGEQRVLIAREVHDVVAYSMSVVHLRASSAQYRLVITSQAAEEFEGLASTARSGVSEVRRLLERLRSTTVDAEPAERRAFGFRESVAGQRPLPSGLAGREPVGVGIVDPRRRMVSRTRS